MEPDITSNYTAILALRTGEYRQYGKQPPTGACRSYLVALIATPPLPGDALEGSDPLAVICAERRGDRWGWVHLSPDAKATIGEDLTNHDAAVGEWYYLAITQQWENPII